MSRLVLKSAADLAIMHEANLVLRRVFDEMRERIRPGLTTADLDALAERRILEADGRPAFKGYPHRAGGPAFPGSVCASVNDEVVHGIPSRRVVLREGDIVSVDVGIRYRGFFGDMAETFAVGQVSPDARRLLHVTREALRLGVEQVRVGQRVSDIGYAVQSWVESSGFSVVREFVGHGIGLELHEDPQVPNFGQPGRRERLVPGMVLAIEPMVNAGSAEVVLDADGWTARTRDGQLSAHFECCVAVTEDGPRILGAPGAV